MTTKKNLSQEIFEQMLDNLSKKRWRPGDQLPPEKELMQLYGVSRITVREAVRQLSSLGLLKTVRGSGTYVCEYNADAFIAPMTRAVFLSPNSKKTVLDVLKLRMFEVIIAGMAAQNATEADTAELARLHEAILAGPDTVEEYVRLDIAFHMQICKMTANPLMYQFCQTIFATLEQVMPYTYKLMGANSAVYFHAKLLDTIGKHYVTEAKQTMEEHLLDAIRAVEKEPEDSAFFAP